MTDKIHEFTAPDGSFGYSLSEDVMIEMMAPLIHSIGKDVLKDRSRFDLIMDAIKDSIGESKCDEVTNNEIIACIIGMVNYNLTIEQMIEEVKNDNIVKYCFEKYNKENNVFNSDNLKNIGGNNIVEITPNVTIGHNLESDVDKLFVMLPIFNELLHTASPKIMREFLHKGYPLLVGEPNEEQLSNVTAGVCLHLRYKRNINEIVDFIKNKTVMDVCFNEFIKEKGMLVISDMIGKPPTSSIN